jgi:hypothetical protein
MLNGNGKVYLFEHLGPDGVTAETILPFSNIEKNPETVKNLRNITIFYIKIQNTRLP